MGTKRLFTVVIVTLFVLGLVVVLLFQSGADEYVVDAALPKLERRFGLDITYNEIDTSLTSVAISGVEARFAESGRLCAKAERVWVGVKVGPLFFGEINITGIRFDGLDLRVGKEAEGATVAEWRELLESVGSTKGAGSTLAKSSHVEVEIASGKINVSQDPFHFTVERIKGKIGSDRKTVLESGGYALTHGKEKLISGKRAGLRFAPETGKVSISADEPIIELPIMGERLLTLVRDARAMVGGLKSTGGDAAGERAVSEGVDSASPLLPRLGSVILAAKDAKGVFLGRSEPETSVSADDMVINASLDKSGSFTAQVAGRLLGTSSDFVLGVRRQTGGPLSVTLEIPGMSLTGAGEALYPSPHLDWRSVTGKGTVEMVFEGGKSTIDFSGQLAIAGLAVEHERLASEPIENLDWNTDFELSLDYEQKKVEVKRLTLSRGVARLTLRGDMLLDRVAFDLNLHLPPMACQQLKATLPEAFTRRIESLETEGHLGLDLHLALDEEAPDEVVLEADLDNRCRIIDFGEIPKPSYFRGPFSYVAYTKDGEDLRLVTGPGTERWTTLIAISPFVVDAVLTTEDGKFFRHKGITVPELRGAISRNLKKKTLGHGASTITMQLAKNLFLSRERTIARKLQELVFVWYLESHFSKEEILELYLNVIEFGPSVYGIRDAAAHYFGRDPMELNAMESVFLIKLLPSPVVRHRSYERGAISARQKAVLKRVLKTMKDKKRLSEAEYNQALTREIVFHKEGTPLPPPRPPVVRHLKLKDMGGLGDEEEIPDSEW